MENQPLVLIPARYDSSRFPGKPLALIFQKPMIQWVVENMLKLKCQVAVVTDNELVQKAVESIGARAIRVDDELESGSERIALAVQRYFPNSKWIINVQGDEPLLEAQAVQELIQAHQGSEFDIMTMIHRRRDRLSFENPNIVKTVFNESTGECQYFSRSPIPHNSTEWFQHIGVYSYKREALEAMSAAPMGSWEKRERLEQLRAMELGLRIGAIEMNNELIGVDTPGDIEKVEEHLRGQAK